MDTVTRSRGTVEGAAATRAWSGRTVTAGVVDTDAVAAFTDGDCYVFAVALRRLVGGALWALSTRPDDEPGYVCHYVVRLDDGRFVDVEGIATEAELLERWSDRHEFIDMDSDTMTALQMLAPELAELVARRLPSQSSLTLHAVSEFDPVDPDDVEFAATVAAVIADRHQLR